MPPTYDKAPARYGPGRAYWERLRAALRGLAAVAVLFAGAAEELATAVLGIPRLSPYLRRIGREIASTYRAGRAGAIDADITDEGGTHGA